MRRWVSFTQSAYGHHVNTQPPYGGNARGATHQSYRSISGFWDAPTLSWVTTQHHGEILTMHRFDSNLAGASAASCHRDGRPA